MAEFKIGDRVRVQRLPTTGRYAGRTGEVVWVTRNPVQNTVVSCNVRLDGDFPAQVSAFLAKELEPETGSAP